MGLETETVICPKCGESYERLLAHVKYEGNDMCIKCIRDEIKNDE